MLIAANIAAGCFNLWLARGEVLTLMYDRDHSKMFTFTAISVPYFAFTEFLPAIVIASTQLKFSKVITPLDNEEVRVRQQAAVDRVIAGIRANARLEQERQG